MALFWAPHFLLLHRGRGTFMHYSNIYSFGRSVAQRLRVVDSTEQYKLKNNRLRQFERALTKKLAAGLSGYVFSTLWKLSHSHGKWPIEIDGLPNLNIVDLSMVFRTSKCWIFPMVIGYTSYLPIYRWFTYQTTRGYIFLWKNWAKVGLFTLAGELTLDGPPSMQLPVGSWWHYFTFPGTLW